MASDGEALTGAWFEGQKYYAAALAVAHEEEAGFHAAAAFARLAVPVGCVGDVAKDSLRRNGHLSRLGFRNSPEAWNTEHVGAGRRRSRGA